MKTRHLLATLAALGLLAPSLLADRVITDDGRILKPKKAREEGDGLRLVFEVGEIVLPDLSRVKAVEIEGDMSDYVPKNDDERKKLEQGYVRYEGRWLSKPAYENQLEKEYQEAKARADDLAAHADFHDAWEKETKHFIVRSNASPELLDYYAELLEAYYSLMDDRFRIKPSPSLRRAKMTVNVHKSRADFHDNNRELSPGVAGFFSPFKQTLNFYHDYQEPAISDWVALHECTHLLTYLIDPTYVTQIWLNEAVADYFGSSLIERDKRGRLEITPGKLQTDRVLTVQQAIKDGNDVHLEDLFKVTRNNFSAFEYAHAWSFVYFLNGPNTKYKKAFDKFFKDIYTLKKGIEAETVRHWDKSGTGKRVPPEEIRRVVLKYLSVNDPEALNKEWKDFIAAIPIEGPEARLKRGYMSVTRGSFFDEDPAKMKANVEECMADLDAAIEAGTEDSRAWWARAQLRMFSDNWEGAEADLLTAIERDPLNARYRFEKGVLTLGEGIGVAIGGGVMISDDKDVVTFDDVPEAQEHLGLAVELAPENEFYREVYDTYMDL